MYTTHLRTVCSTKCVHTFSQNPEHTYSKARISPQNYCSANRKNASGKNHETPEKYEKRMKEYHHHVYLPHAEHPIQLLWLPQL